MKFLGDGRTVESCIGIFTFGYNAMLTIMKFLKETNFMGLKIKVCLFFYTLMFLQFSSVWMRKAPIPNFD